MKRRELLKGVLGALAAIPLYGLSKAIDSSERCSDGRYITFPLHTRHCLIKGRQMGFSSYNGAPMTIDQEIRGPHFYWLTENDQHGYTISSKIHS